MLASGKKEEALTRYRALLDLPADDKTKAEIQTKLKQAMPEGGEGAKGNAKETKPDAKP
jgi:hypothetical protein